MQHAQRARHVWSHDRQPVLLCRSVLVSTKTGGEVPLSRFHHVGISRQRRENDTSHPPLTFDPSLPDELLGPVIRINY